MSSSALAKFIRRVLVMCFYLYIHIQAPNVLHRFRSAFVAGTAKLRTMPDTRNSDRRCEAPQGGAIKQLEPRNSDRRCEAPQGGAIKQLEPRNSDRRCEAPQGGAIRTAELLNSDRRCVAPQGGAI